MMPVREESKSSAQTLELPAAAPDATLLLELLLNRPPGPAAVSTAPAGDLVAQIRSATSRNDLARLVFSERKIGARAGSRQLDLAIARLDDELARQVNAILHHPRFQALESSWRGLAFLCQQSGEETERAEAQGEDTRIVLRMLSVSKRELWDDATSATEFDQTVLWQKVYE